MIMSSQAAINDRDALEVLNIQQTAAMLHVSTKTLQRLAAERKVPCQKIGREYRFSRTALLAWLNGAKPPSRR